jgi:hypothetical protein
MREVESERRKREVESVGEGDSAKSKVARATCVSRHLSFIERMLLGETPSDSKLLGERCIEPPPEFMNQYILPEPASTSSGRQSFFIASHNAAADGFNVAKQFVTDTRRLLQ